MQAAERTVKRFGIYQLRPAPSEEDKSGDAETALCMVISPDEMNRHVGVVMVVPLVAAGPGHPARVAYTLDGTCYHIVLDRAQVVDKSRLGDRVGEVSPHTQAEIRKVVASMLKI